MLNPYAEVPNRDSRDMQPLPWLIDRQGEGGAPTLRSKTGRDIMSFWGGDTRCAGNPSWCTKAQAEEHAKYAEHACNNFPLLIETLEYFYDNLETMTDEMKKEGIEAVMKVAYYERMPKYVGRR